MTDLKLFEVIKSFDEKGTLSHSEARYLIDSLNRAIGTINAIEVEMNCTYCCDKHISIANDSLRYWNNYRGKWNLWYQQPR